MPLTNCGTKSSIATLPDARRFYRAPLPHLVSTRYSASLALKSFTLSDAYTAQSADPCQQSAGCCSTPVANKCRGSGQLASIGGICGPRFTAPKYLGSMVRIRCQTWIVPRSED